jgi:acetyltransferase-like isoleucine patch superfamily enzyme
MINSIKLLIFKTIFFILSGENRNKFLRWYGLKIGKGCQINATGFSTEPFLIEIGDHVAVSNGSKFITHDGSIWIMEEKHPNLDLFGPIKIGNNSFIGMDAIILPNTTIGSNCIIGAGSVIRGIIPDNSLVIGNPGKVIMTTGMMETVFCNHKHCLKTKNLTAREKKQNIKDHFNK